VRLQLVIGAAIALHASIGGAQDVAPGEGQATSRLLVYSDDDSTQVVTSTVDAQVAIPGNVQIGTHALIDVVSSASVDVVTAATGRWDENRVELGARAGWEVADVGLSVGYTRSQENDWLSHSIVVGGQKELFARNTVLAGFYSLTLNTVGRASDPNFERSLDAHNGEVSVSQLVDPKTRVGAAYTLQVLSGFLSSPYRFVVASDGSRGPERHPDSRVRHALSASVVRSLTRSLSGRAAYRFYLDDWGIRSHTVSLRLAAEPHRRVLVGIEGRGYIQNRADFYRGVYPTSFRYMSFDRELSTFWDAGGIADAQVTVGPVIADAKVGVIYYKFDDFPALPDRTALIAGGGAKVVW
jgi:hypothetical protein